MKAASLAAEYYVGCRRRVPEVAGIVSRGPLEDVLPDLSDIDLRIVCRAVPAGGWDVLDEAVLRTHLELTARDGEAGRLLQHPPGAVFLAGELADERLVHPEARLWQWIAGDDTIHEIVSRLAGGWTRRDETYHLGRYLGACGDWGADPSATDDSQRCRCRGALVHYFLPALESVRSLEAGHALAGRLRALAAYRQSHPGDEVLEQIERLVEGQTHVSPTDCRCLAAECRMLLAGLAPEVARSLGHSEPRPCRALECLGDRLRSRQAEPLTALYDAVRFSRIRPSHYRLFLAQGPEGDWLVANELATMRTLLVQPALAAYSELRWGLPDLPASETIVRLRLDCSVSEVAAMERLLALQGEGAASAGAARVALAEAVYLFPTYRLVLERLLVEVMAVVDRVEELAPGHVSGDRTRECHVR